MKRMKGVTARESQLYQNKGWNSMRKLPGNKKGQEIRRIEQRKKVRYIKLMKGVTVRESSLYKNNKGWNSAKKLPGNKKIRYKKGRRV